MATVTLKKYLDDFSIVAERPEPADVTIQFAFDGENFEIDLTHKNAAIFEEVMNPYLSVARPAKRAYKKKQKLEVELAEDIADENVGV
jgi:hypothetical protein